MSTGTVAASSSEALPSTPVAAESDSTDDAESSASEIDPGTVKDRSEAWTCEDVEDYQDMSSDSIYRRAVEELVRPWALPDAVEAARENKDQSLTLEETKAADTTVLMDDTAREAESWTGGSNSREEPVLSLVSLNTKKASSFDLVRGTMAVVAELPSTAGLHARTVRVSCGRDAGNTIVLSDSRVSSIHFSLRVRAAKGGLVSLELIDQSSNGTWVNGKRVGKGRRLCLSVGDKVLVLPASQVGDAAEIGYLLLHDVRGAKCAPTLGSSGRLDETAALTLSANELNGNPPLSRALEPELECHICTEALYQCLTLVPCGHNFCAPCLLKWRKNSPNCPECRAPIQQGVRNHSVDKVVESFRQAHPEACRSDSELKALDALDHDPEYRAMLRWFLKEGPWSELHNAPTPMQRNRDTNRARRPRAPQSRSRQPSRSQSQQSRRATEESSSVCVVS
eukprot:TRINITY_DN76068_c0_g1_i1.p1 TRINITY_DN76068_c0_g1~~TRINITY_DN76068_c0_g1_i1.p1  ORF type:complete len:463 (+),score=59.49 TRINITY_DN76068_c0_g1_i1:33-1391(+)